MPKIRMYLEYGNQQCTFASESPLFKFLKNWDPFYYTSFSKTYPEYRIFKTLNRVITLERLYDPHNTKVIVLNDQLANIFGEKVFVYKALQSIVRKKLSLLSQTSDWKYIRLYANWHCDDTFIEKCNRDDDFRRLQDRFYWVTRPMLEIINIYFPDVEESKPLVPVGYLNSARNWYEKQLVKTYEWSYDDVYQIKGTVLENICGANFILQSQYVALFASQCFLPASEGGCNSCGRREIKQENYNFDSNRSQLYLSESELSFSELDNVEIYASSSSEIDR